MRYRDVWKVLDSIDFRHQKIRWDVCCTYVRGKVVVSLIRMFESGTLQKEATD